MEQTLTEEEVRVMYQDKQEEPFPVRKNIMGILLAVIFFTGVLAVWCGVLWVIAKVS